MLKNPHDHVERQAFAAKLRTARAVLGWTQLELAREVHLTQRSIHRLEQGHSEPKLATVRAFERLWREKGVCFQDLDDGGFELMVRAATLASSTTSIQ